MLKPIYTKQFEKDLKLCIKRGKDKEKIKVVIEKLGNEKKLEARYKNHKLSGSFVGRKECHIEPDWLLIYKIETEHIIFERTGSHSDLFK